MPQSDNRNDSDNERAADRPTRIIRANQLAKVAGISPWTAKRIPDFPQRVQLSAQITGWYEGEVLEWLARRPRLKKSKKSDG